MDRIPQHLPCTKCGECCKHGGQCIFRNWGPDGQSTKIEFVGRCQFLRADLQCEKIAAAEAVGQRDLKRHVPGTCNWPAQFVRFWAPDVYKTIIVDGGYDVD